MWISNNSEFVDFVYPIERSCTFGHVNDSLTTKGNIHNDKCAGSADGNSKMGEMDGFSVSITMLDIRSSHDCVSVTWLQTMSSLGMEQFQIFRSFKTWKRRFCRWFWSKREFKSFRVQNFWTFLTRKHFSLKNWFLGFYENFCAFFGGALGGG